MLEAGEDARFIARRLVILASEDVGMADPHGLLVADAAAQAVEFVGLPEAQLNLAQAVVHLATAPKSNRVTIAHRPGPGRRARTGAPARCPHHLRDAHYQGAKSLGHGRATSTPTTTRGLGGPAVPAGRARGPRATTSRRPTATRPRWRAMAARRSRPGPSADRGTALSAGDLAP